MFLLFFCVWLILNGRITAEICILGLAIAALLFYFICRFMDYSIKKELLMFKLTPWFVRYFWVLVEEIAKANLNVLKLILSPDTEPEPAMVYFDIGLRTGIAKVILADSITLTPGTITVAVEGDRFCVHCLDWEFAEGMEESVFVRLLEEMERIYHSMWLEKAGGQMPGKAAEDERGAVDGTEKINEAKKEAAIEEIAEEGAGWN